MTLNIVAIVFILLEFIKGKNEDTKIRIFNMDDLKLLCLCGQEQ